MRRFSALFILSGLILSNPSIAEAESMASKNREGNRLFAEGKYEEAEKAYLEAQVSSPGKPEILYNLGNSLIKQGKHTQGVQALQQSADKGDKHIKTDSLYNTGNALYSMGDYKGSSEAFIEALKLNPEDKDAKHNLELALRKLQQQQQQSDSDKEQQDSKDRENRPEESSGNRQQPEEQDRKQMQGSNTGEDNGKMQPEAPDRREGSMTKEEAQKILDAMRNQELEQQRRKVEALPGSNPDKRDW